MNCPSTFSAFITVFRRDTNNLEINHWIKNNFQSSWTLHSFSSATLRLVSCSISNSCWWSSTLFLWFRWVDVNLPFSHKNIKRTSKMIPNSTKYPLTSQTRKFRQNKNDEKKQTGWFLLFSSCLELLWLNRRILRISFDLHGFCILNSIPVDGISKKISNETEFQWKNTMEEGNYFGINSLSTIMRKGMNHERWRW